MSGEGIRKIVVGTDFNALATSALRFAAAIAARSGAELIVVYADTFEPPAEFTSTQVPLIASAIEHSKVRTRRELEAYAAQHIPKDVAWRAVVAEGHPATALAAVADAEAADFIAVGTHGRGGLQRLVMGSVAETVLREARVPVLTLRSTEPSQRIERVLYPAGDDDAAPYAARMAAALEAELMQVPLQDFSPDERDLIVIAGNSRIVRELIRNAPMPVLRITHASVTER